MHYYRNMTQSKAPLKAVVITEHYRGSFGYRLFVYGGMRTAHPAKTKLRLECGHWAHREGHVEPKRCRCLACGRVDTFCADGTPGKLNAWGFVVPL